MHYFPVLLVIRLSHLFSSHHFTCNATFSSFSGSSADISPEGSEQRRAVMCGVGDRSCSGRQLLLGRVTIQDPSSWSHSNSRTSRTPTSDHTCPHLPPPCLANQHAHHDNPVPGLETISVLPAVISRLLFASAPHHFSRNWPITVCTHSGPRHPASAGMVS